MLLALQAEGKLLSSRQFVELLSLQGRLIRQSRVASTLGGGLQDLRSVPERRAIDARVALESLSVALIANCPSIRRCLA